MLRQHYSKSWWLYCSILYLPTIHYLIHINNFIQIKCHVDLLYYFIIESSPRPFVALEVSRKEHCGLDTVFLIFYNPICTCELAIAIMKTDALCFKAMLATDWYSASGHSCIQGHNCNDVSWVIKNCNNLFFSPITNVLAHFAFV